MKEKLNEKDTFTASCLLLCVFYRFYMLKFNKGRLSLYFIGRQLIPLHSMICQLHCIPNSHWIQLYYTL